MKRVIVAATRANTSFMPELVKAAFANVSNPSAPYIDILDEMNQMFKKNNIVLEMTDDSGMWKYGDVGIKQSWYGSDHMIHIEVEGEFYDRNEGQVDYLIRVLSQIYVHENTHGDQYVKNPNMGLEGEVEDYYTLSYEIEAHAVDAVEGFIQIGYDPKYIIDNNDWEDKAAEVESAWVYWDGYGRYDEEGNDPTWQAFLKAFREEVA